MADRRERRRFALVAGGGVVCAALAALAAGKPWVEVQRATDRLGTVSAVSDVLGPFATSAPALALALVALAAWGVLLVVRGRARTVMAVAGLVFALALVVVVVLGYAQVPDAVRRALVNQVGASPAAAARAALPHTGWYWLALVSALGDVVALGVAARQAHRWPAMGARYDAPGTEPGVDARREQDMWRTLDEGRDPTDPGSA